MRNSGNRKCDRVDQFANILSSAFFLSCGRITCVCIMPLNSKATYLSVYSYCPVTHRGSSLVLEPLDITPDNYVRWLVMCLYPFPSLLNCLGELCSEIVCSEVRTSRVIINPSEGPRSYPCVCDLTRISSARVCTRVTQYEENNFKPECIHTTLSHSYVVLALLPPCPWIQLYVPSMLLFCFRCVYFKNIWIPCTMNPSQRVHSDSSW